MTETMTAPAEFLPVRDRILADPDAILDDAELMAALVAADDARRGSNVVDLRGLALARLEDRLGRLEVAHQTVLSAAYDNVATTRQVHRAILALMAPLDLDGFFACLATEVADILRVTSVRLLVETAPDAAPVGLPATMGIVQPVAPREVEAYQHAFRAGRRSDVVLRRVQPDMAPIHDTSAGPVLSEALIRIDLGAGWADALLVLGAPVADHYQSGQATDLIELFGRVFERTLRGFLA